MAAPVNPVRQRTQYSCGAASLSMALKALGCTFCDEDKVNEVMGAAPMQGASWEQIAAAANHYGCRSTLVIPSTLAQVRQWTDAGKPVLIGWNPEDRPWSHASLVFDVTDSEVLVADPNCPDPAQTVRTMSHADFYRKWSEEWNGYKVRRPAMLIDREVDVEGRQVMASQRKQASSARSHTTHMSKNFAGAKEAMRDLIDEWGTNGKVAGEVEADSDGSYMSVGYLKALAGKAKDLLEYVDNDTELPDWAEAKIGQAANALAGVHDYFAYQNEGDQMDLEDQYTMLPKAVMAKFEEGKSVDVPKYLEEHGNPEAAKEWVEQNEANRDKFKTAGLSYGLIASWFAFVGNAPFNSDTIEAIRNIYSIPWKDDNGTLITEEMALQVGQRFYSGPLTYTQEKQGMVREMVVEVQHPEGMNKTLLLKALQQLGRQFKFKVEPLAGPRKALTRKKAMQDRSAAEAVELSKEGYKAVAKALAGWEGEPAWTHVVTYANSGRAMDAKHVKTVVTDIGKYLQNWAAQSKANGWSAADKKALTAAKGILETKLSGKTASAVQYRKLSDAANLTGIALYLPGQCKIWYWQQQYGRDFMQGSRPDMPLPTPETIKDTHVLIGAISARSPREAYELMQAENWSPEGEANMLIRMSGSGHTSMSVGDIVELSGKLIMVDRMGFKDLAMMAQGRVAANLPADVERYVEETKASNPDYDEGQVWAVAWSRYCKYKNPGSEHCTMDASDYFKTACGDDMDDWGATLDEGATLADWEPGHIVPDAPQGDEWGSELPGDEMGRSAKVLSRSDSLDRLLDLEKKHGRDTPEYYDAAIKEVQDGVIAPAAVVGGGYKDGKKVALMWLRNRKEDKAKAKDKTASELDGVMAELDHLAEGCPDNLDAEGCDKWEANTDKYQDVVKDQHKAASRTRMTWSRSASEEPAKEDEAAKDEPAKENKTAAGKGAVNKAFLGKIDSKTKAAILGNIAKHYDISVKDAEAEVTDAQAEHLLDYLTGPERAATSLLMKRHAAAPSTVQGWLEWED
jgi:predicted double-glycine peptidase